MKRWGRKTRKKWFCPNSINTLDKNLSSKESKTASFIILRYQKKGLEQPNGVNEWKPLMAIFN